MTDVDDGKERFWKLADNIHRLWPDDVASTVIVQSLVTACRKDGYKNMTYDNATKDLIERISDVSRITAKGGR